MIGVIGGMGPAATVDFLAKVIAETPAQDDADHVPMLISCDPRLPLRPAAILHGTGWTPAFASAGALSVLAAIAVFIVVKNRPDDAPRTEPVPVHSPPIHLLKESLRLLPDLLRLLRRLTTTRDLPTGVRVRVALLFVYLAMPIDVIPDAIPARSGGWP